MKILYVILSFFLITSTAWAEKVYLLMNKAGNIDEGTVQDIRPVSNGITMAERGGYRILVVDLTEEEQLALLQAKEVGTGVFEADGRELKNQVDTRNLKVDLKALEDIKQEREVDKTTFMQRVSVKSVAITPR